MTPDMLVGFHPKPGDRRGARHAPDTPAARVRSVWSPTPRVVGAVAAALGSPAARDPQARERTVTAA